VVDDTEIREWKLPARVEKAFFDAKAGFERPSVEHVNIGRHRGNNRLAEAMAAKMKAKQAKPTDRMMELTRTSYKNPTQLAPATAEFVEMTGLGKRLAAIYMNSTKGDVEKAFREMRRDFTSGRVTDIDEKRNPGEMKKLENELARVRLKK